MCCVIANQHFEEMQKEEKIKLQLGKQKKICCRPLCLLLHSFPVEYPPHDK